MGLTVHRIRPQWLALFGGLPDRAEVLGMIARVTEPVAWDPPCGIGAATASLFAREGTAVEIAEIRVFCQLRCNGAC